MSNICRIIYYSQCVLKKKGIRQMVIDAAKANQKVNKISKFRIICLIIALLICFFGIQYARSYKILQEKQARLLSVEEQITGAEMESDRLITLCEELDSQQYIERIAREDLGMVKEGEILIIPVQ